MDGVALMVGVILGVGVALTPTGSVGGGMVEELGKVLVVALRLVKVLGVWHYQLTSPMTLYSILLEVVIQYH